MENKILSFKNYGSIPHLSESKKNQQADKKININAEKLLTEKKRKGDIVYITEKLDGSNVGIIKKNNKLYAITRKGYLAETSPYNQHHEFVKWVNKYGELFKNLPENYRICGEWLYSVHGTFYEIPDEISLFNSFDIFDEKNKRTNYRSFSEFCFKNKIKKARLIYEGEALSIEKALQLLGNGEYCKNDIPEGLVYRLETNGIYNFMAKYVREGKEDGKYMNEEIKNIFLWEK